MTTFPSRPWLAYALRILCCALMFLSAYSLLVGSTFAMRMRQDFPVQSLVVALSVILAFSPLLAGRRYLGALLISAFLISGIGGYWWTTIPWDEFVKDSEFPTAQRPGFLEYALVATPAVVAAFYAVVSRPSLLRADLVNRGVEPQEIRSAMTMSFLSGAALLVFCGGLTMVMWQLMSSGIVFAALAPIPQGIPAIILVAALASVAYALLAGRLPAPWPWARHSGPRLESHDDDDPETSRKARLWARISRRRASS